jgi:hypothetical protein
MSEEDTGGHPCPYCGSVDHCDHLRNGSWPEVLAIFAQVGQPPASVKPPASHLPNKLRELSCPKCGPQFHSQDHASNLNCRRIGWNWLSVSKARGLSIRPERCPRSGGSVEPKYPNYQKDQDGERYEKPIHFRLRRMVPQYLHRDALRESSSDNLKLNTDNP